LADPKSFISSLTIPFYEEHDYFFVYVEYQNFTGIHQEEIILHVFILFQENSLLLSETNTIIQSYWDRVYSRRNFNQIWLLKYWISWIILIILLFQNFLLFKHVTFLHFQTIHRLRISLITWLSSKLS
jgi:hypothetical protein